MLDCFQSALTACDPYLAVHRSLKIKNEGLITDAGSFSLLPAARVYLCALGKAALPMVQAAREVLGDHYAGGIAVTKALSPGFEVDEHLTVMIGDHPVPGDRSLAAGQALISFCRHVQEPDILIFLISGGGSSLAVCPVDGVTLPEIRQLTDVLLRASVPIADINVIRRQLDQVKNGGLLHNTSTSGSLTLILSDVVDGGPAVVASGPTLADRSSKADCLRVIAQAGMTSRIPENIISFLEDGRTGEKYAEGVSQTAIIAHPHQVIGDNRMALRAIRSYAERNGCSVILSEKPLTGPVEIEAERIFSEFSKITSRKIHLPLLMCWGGEVTVERKGNQPGGRNSHLALLLANRISGLAGVSGAALATDGEDGSCPAAGAYFDGTTAARTAASGISIHDCLAQFASYQCFSSLGDAVLTGSTGTNVNDIVIMIKDNNDA